MPKIYGIEIILLSQTAGNNFFPRVLGNSILHLHAINPGMTRITVLEKHYKQSEHTANAAFVVFVRFCRLEKGRI